MSATQTVPAPSQLHAGALQAHTAGQEPIDPARLKKMRKAVEKFCRTHQVAEDDLKVALRVKNLKETSFWAFAKPLFRTSSPEAFRRLALVASGAADTSAEPPKDAPEISPSDTAVSGKRTDGPRDNAAILSDMLAGEIALSQVPATQPDAEYVSPAPGRYFDGHASSGMAVRNESNDGDGPTKPAEQSSLKETTTTSADAPIGLDAVPPSLATMQAPATRGRDDLTKLSRGAVMSTREKTPQPRQDSAQPREQTLQLRETVPPREQDLQRRERTPLREVTPPTTVVEPTTPVRGAPDLELLDKGVPTPSPRQRSYGKRQRETAVLGDPEPNEFARPRKQARRSNASVSSATREDKGLPKARPSEDQEYINLRDAWTAARRDEVPFNTGPLDDEEQATLDRAVQDYMTEMHLTEEEFCVELEKNKLAMRRFLYVLRRRNPKNMRLHMQRHYRTQPKGVFTTEEDFKIMDLIEEFGHDFKRIGAQMGRFSEDVRDRYRNVLKHEAKQSGPFTEAEDRLLMAATRDLSTEDSATTWEMVAKTVGTRSRIQCRDRYYRLLNTGYVQVASVNEQVRVAKRLPAASATSSPVPRGTPLAASTPVAAASPSTRRRVALLPGDRLYLMQTMLDRGFRSMKAARRDGLFGSYSAVGDAESVQEALAKGMPTRKGADFVNYLEQQVAHLKTLPPRERKMQIVLDDTSDGSSTASEIEQDGVIEVDDSESDGEAEGDEEMQEEDDDGGDDDHVVDHDD